MNHIYEEKDNEFVAWYPCRLSPENADAVWRPRRAGYYVHIPFCTAICDYCGFAIEKHKPTNTARYITALRTEIERYSRRGQLSQYKFVCGHFGGGTPSVLDGPDLMSIKRLIDSSFDVVSGAEITVEVNPISFTESKAEAYHDAGVNRISFGVQSFNDRTLKTIGRPHRARDVEATLQVIRKIGWRNYSLDIMYGVPGQTMADLEEDLQQAAATGAAHISCFRLEIIPFTVLKMREAASLLPQRLPSATLNQMDDLVASVLRAAGYRHYGAFNFALPGFESLHNAIAFMPPQAEYIGFGNSSYSYINQHIYCNHADIETYQEAVFAGRDPIALSKRVTAREAMSRFFVLGLKFFRVRRSDFVDDFGMQPEEVFGETLTRLMGNGMLIREGDDYVLTHLGRYYVNNVVKEFFTAENKGERQYAQFVPTITPEQITYFTNLTRESRRAE